MRPGGAASVFGDHPGGRLSLFTPDGSPSGTVPVGRFPLTSTSSPDGSLGYVSGVVDSTVTVVGLARPEALATLTLPELGVPGAHGLAYLPSAG